MWYVWFVMFRSRWPFWKEAHAPLGYLLAYFIQIFLRTLVYLSSHFFLSHQKVQLNNQLLMIKTSFCNFWKSGCRKFSLSCYFCLSNSCANKVYEWFGLSITLLFTVMHWKINVMELPQFHLPCVEAQEK